MKWYLTAFATCVVACTIAVVVERGRADTSDLAFLLVKWTGIGSVALAVLCVTIALGCGAPRVRPAR